jgi:hypothetical protein
MVINKIKDTLQELRIQQSSNLHKLKIIDLKTMINGGKRIPNRLQHTSLQGKEI